MSCRVTELSIRGVRTVVLENESLCVSLLADKGTDIYEFVHKPTDTNFLWKPATGVRPYGQTHDSPEATSGFFDFYEGGWQEIFPNGGDNCLYKGAEMGFHGEACKIPWDYTVHEREGERVSVKFTVRLMRTPFAIEKWCILEAGKATLRLEERVANEGEEPMEFMWGHHPAFAPPFLGERNLLSVPATTIETHDVALPAESQHLPLGVQSKFPFVKGRDGKRRDLRRLFPGDGRTADLAYLGGLKEGWYAVVNQDTKLGFALRWDRNVLPYIWLWQECRGTRGYPWWGRYHVVGIEPHSSVPGSGLLKAIERGTALRLEAGASLELKMCATAFVARGEVKGVKADGQVVC